MTLQSDAIHASGSEQINVQSSNAKHALEAGQSTLLYRRLVADTHTAVSIALRLHRPERGDFLLESVEGGETRGRYSLIGLDPDLLFRAQGKEACVNYMWQHDRDAFTQCDEGPLDALRNLAKSCHMVLPDDLPPAAAFLVGYFGYETVSLVEAIKRSENAPLDIPDMVFVRPSMLIIVDRLKDEMFLLAPLWKDQKGSISKRLDAAQERLDECERMLAQSVELSNQSAENDIADITITPAIAPEDYLKMVLKAKDYILAGDIFQVVLAQRFSTPFSLGAMDLYRALRRINPSPFLFFLDLPDMALIGSSPEILVRSRDGEVTIRPIAGTRPRGGDDAEDRANEVSLLADPKECAEHLMLLDLGRNDVGRVAEANSVTVTDSYMVERYSHVMHIVSNVTGKLAADKDAVDALMAGFPAGTVSGAPKVRACEIIAELEPEERGAYAGAVGYFAPDGSVDSCIVLRTAVLKGGMMHVQAGAGIVADSNPEYEQRECEAKSGALFAAAREAVAQARKGGFGQ
ncbi:anthranilate synthase component I [Parasphingorhabdus sp. DH2-15]|uniref:anthranilate synthase component I n=1 Tax=Parasphingorhabdus sp. DH2-15 TaxID=3444112 RepID=UPI003F682B35